jgi:Pentapeptide repeats (8 copies)
MREPSARDLLSCRRRAVSGSISGTGNYTVVVLRGADLTLANLNNADLREADLHDAKLRDADLSGARLPEHVGVPSGWELNAILHTPQRVPQ